MGHTVGSEIDGYCTKCRMVLAHTILAMMGERVARVRCNTCNGEHTFRAGPPGTAKGAPRKAGTSTTRSRAQVINFDELLAGKDLTQAKSYSPSGRFAADQVIDHQTFGRGVVQASRTDKIDVTFRSFVKTLIHNRPAGPKPVPAHTPAIATAPIEDSSASE